MTSYDASILNPPRPTDESWAIAATRFYLKDRDGDQYSDSELLLVLTGTSFISSNTRYYRPHIAAADIIDSDPDRAMNESVLGASIGLRTPDQISRAIRKAGRWIDALITDVAGESPPSRLIVTPTF